MLRVEADWSRRAGFRLSGARRGRIGARGEGLAAGRHHV